jgi:hypothetical protein
MMLAEHRCLSEALYYEARGEGPKGEQAVAEVVFHRMNAGNYGTREYVQRPSLRHGIRRKHGEVQNHL